MVKQIRRRRRAPASAQRPLLPAPTADEAVGVQGSCEFLRVDRSQLYVGDRKLDEYLVQAGLGWVVELAKLVAKSDLEPFRSKYEGVGRRPHHPHAMVGLFVYGALHGKTSLRELEQLAVVDVGAWWICAGHQPDHSAIGRFLQRHREHLSDDFFVEVTKTLLQREKIQRGTVATDGTVIEAAASRLKMMRAEALQTELKAEKAVVVDVVDAAAQAQKVQRLEAATAVAVERQAKRTGKGKAGAIKVAVDEPEAVNQPLKNGLDRPSYKPVLSTHESGYVVGQTVEPSNENAALPALMTQHERLFGAAPRRALMDSGFFATAILMLMIDADVDALCPPPGMLVSSKTEEQKYRKHRFVYIDEKDVYRCPAEHDLVAIERSSDQRGGAYTKYGAAPCAACPQRANCTTGKRGRTIKRYTHDDAKDAMRAVLGDRRAQAEYRKRQHIAETPNATIKNVQGLKRFRRRGLRGAKLEVALHCVALNLGRASAFAAVISVNGRPLAVVIAIRQH